MSVEQAISKLLFASFSEQVPAQNFSYEHEIDSHKNKLFGEHIFIWLVSYEDLFWQTEEIANLEVAYWYSTLSAFPMQHQLQREPCLLNSASHKKSDDPIKNLELVNNILPLR